MREVAAIKKLKGLTAELAGISVESEEEIATQGLLLGAAYGLLQAAERRYSDSRNSAGKSALKGEFKQVASNLAAGRTPEEGWLAGFYFSSALMRITGCRERLDCMEGKDVNTAGELRRVVNTLKHHPNAHVHGDWKITFAGALESFSQQCSRLQRIVTARDDLSAVQPLKAQVRNELR